MPRINNVEIFASGVWNGHTITDADLDNMVDAFNKTSAKVRPHLKLGHDKEQKLIQNDGLPAAGWIANLRKEGSKLVADFIDMPKKIKELVDAKAYRKVSAEVFSNITILGQVFPKMLGAVALLGANTPGVMNLDDILAWYSADGGFESVDFAKDVKLDTIVKEFEFTEEPSMPNKNEDLDNQLDLAAKENAKLKAELSKNQDKFNALEGQVTSLEEAGKEAAKAILAGQLREKEAKVSQFASELLAEDLISKAMTPLIKEAFSEKDEFSIGEKKYDKFSIFKEIMVLSKEFSKINFGANTDDTGGKDSTEDKLIAFAKDHNIDLDVPGGYSKAYREFSSAKKGV